MSLVAYWPGDDGSGDTIVESINGNDATITGPLNWVNDAQKGMVHEFAPGTSSYAQDGDDIPCTPGIQFSLACWIYVSTDDYQSPFVLGKIDNTSTSTAGMDWGFVFNGWGSTIVIVRNGVERLTSINLAIGGWTQIAFVNDSTYFLYANNSVVAGGPPLGVGDTQNTPSRQVYLGATPSFNGEKTRFKDLVVYDHAMTPQEVDDHYNGNINIPEPSPGSINNLPLGRPF